MPRLRTALLAVAGLAALLLLAVWQVPQWLDWTRYRTTVEVLASATLGQPVTIRGPISLTLLPQPVLTAAQVDVGGQSPNDLSFHVEALRLRTALWPLLTGHVDARELVLRGPDLHIPSPVEPGVLRPHPPSWLAAFAARVEDGRLTVGRLAFTGIDATLATLDTGALSASGTAKFSGQDWHFTGKVTASGADGASGLNLTLDGQGRAAGLGASFSGQWGADGTLAGAVAARGPNLAVLLPTPPVPFRADGRLTMGSGLAAIDDLALEIGGSPASGAVALRIAPNQRLDIALSASRLDLDAWLPVLLRASSTVAGFDVPTGIDFSAEAAPFGGGTLEHVRAAFDLIGKDLVLREATARLPGNAMLRLTGRVARGDPAPPRFDGDASLDAPVLRTTLRWLDEAMPRTLPAGLLATLPDGVAQRAHLAAHVTGGSGDIVLQRLAGTLDDAPISGSLGLKRGEPPAFTANLTLDRLALDSWLPQRASLGRPPVAFDAELRLNVRQASLGGVAIDGLAVDAALEAGRLLFRRFEGVARGAHIVASGMLGDGGALSDGRLSVDTPDATPLAELLPAAWRATPALWHGKATLNLQASGPPEALAMSLRLALGDARLEAAASVNLKSAEWSSSLTLRHPGARRLVGALGVPEQDGLRGLQQWLGEGSLSLVARLAGAPGRIAAEKFDLNAAAFRAGGDLTLDLRGGEPLVAGHVQTDVVTLPLPDGGSSQPLPLVLLRGWRGELQLGIGELGAGALVPLRDASMTVAVADGALRIDRFTARLGSGALTGSASFDTAAGSPALAIQAGLRDWSVTDPVDGTPIDLLAGHGEASLRLAASGFSPSALLATLRGHAELAMQDGAVAGFDLFRLKLSVEKPDPRSVESAAGEALRGGSTGFTRLALSGNVDNGNLILDTASLTGVAGEAHASGSVNLADQTLDVRITLQPALANPPEVAIHLSGPLDQPNRTIELAGLARWMAELVR